MFNNSPLEQLHYALSHAQYSGFPEIEYEDRDWELYVKTKESKLIKKTKQHAPTDIAVFSMFQQSWGSTALGFGGLGGQAITMAYTIVLESVHGYGFCVYFGGKFAYRIQKPSQEFFADVRKFSVASVKESHQKYEIIK